MLADLSRLPVCPFSNRPLPDYSTERIFPPRLVVPLRFKLMNDCIIRPLVIALVALQRRVVSSRFRTWALNHS